jgi:hypothetical protein
VRGVLAGKVMAELFGGADGMSGAWAARCSTPAADAARTSSNPAPTGDLDVTIVPGHEIAEPLTDPDLACDNLCSDDR